MGGLAGFAQGSELHCISFSTVLDWWGGEAREADMKSTDSADR